MTTTIGSATMLLIADDNNDGTVDTSAIVTPALTSASSFADTYLAAYLPITTVPDVLREAVIMIAAQNIRLPRDKSTDDSALAFKNAVDWLTKIANGTASLPGADGDDDTDPGDPEIDAGDRIWSRDISSRLL
jgi:phage gp36-like protein